MNFLKNLVVLGAALQLCACASILSGTEQTIAVTSTPVGADCDLSRKESSDGAPEQFARVAPTPGSVTVDRTKYDITVRCALPGYETGAVVLESGTEGMAMGNTIAGGVIGWGVDSAFGADNKYPSHVNVPLAASPATVSTAPVNATPLAAAVAPAAPIPLKPVAATKTPLSAPLAAKIAPAATAPNAPVNIATKYPKVAPQPVEQEPTVTGYIAPVPWYKPLANKPQASIPAAVVAPEKQVMPATKVAPAKPVAASSSPFAAASTKALLPVKPQEVSDKGSLAK